MEEWKDPSVILGWMGVGILFLLLLLTFIVVLTRLIIRNMVRERLEKSRLLLENQQRLTKATIKTQEKERERIAADLHDELIGKLNAVKMACEMNAQDFNYLQHMDQCIATARRISHDLSPPLLEFSSVEEIWLEAVSVYRLSHQVTIHVTQNYAVEKSVEFKLQFLRVVQELLMNIYKHANATQISITYRATRKQISIIIADNGNGYDSSSHKHGLGLSSVETRIQYMAGIFKVRTGIGKGTSVTLWFPLENTM